ncbi:MAG: hypothetical protein V3W41_05020 [Planctomycetota bacterium]
MNADYRTTEIESAKDAVAYLGGRCWHDSVLYEIVLVRTESLDQVILKLDLLSDWENQTSQAVELIFGGCWHVQTKMSWGVKCMSGGEMIGAAESLDSDPAIERVRATWDNAGVSLGDIGLFRMDLASTSSTIEVVFSKITVRHFGTSGPHRAPPPLHSGGGN